MDINILTVGSSLSKGAFDFSSAKRNLNRVGSIIQCSFASQGLKPLPPFKLNGITEQKQHLLNDDCSKNLIDKINSHQFDYILIDFIDERYDIYTSNTGRGCLLSSSQLRAMFKSKNGEIIDAFSDEAFNLWLKGWKSFLRNMIATGNYHKLVINEVYWHRCKKENNFLKKIYTEVKNHIPSTQFIHIKEGEFNLDDSHPWGPSRIHFENAYYDAIKERLYNLIEWKKKGLNYQKLNKHYKEQSGLVKRLLSLKNDPFVKEGECIVEGKTLKFKGFNDYKFSVPYIWKVDPFNSRTWMWSLHQFSVINPLLAYDLNYSSNEGFKLGCELISKWAEAFISDDRVEPGWHDHSTALRARNFLTFFLYGLNNLGNLNRNIGKSFLNFLDLLQSLLQLHIEILAEEDFYSKGTNHGLDQSLILYEVSSFFIDWETNQSYNSLSANRIAAEISNAFKQDGGHVENSPGYLNFGIKQMVEALTLQNTTINGVKIPIDPSTLDLSTKVLTYFVRPNGMLPQIGDTVDFKVNDIFNQSVKPSEAVYNQFKYAISRGKSGKRPCETDLILERSGYAILRDKWHEAHSYEQGVHLVLKSSFLSRYHRQDDDTSVTLFAHGEEWLIDSGLYKYEEKDPYRVYMRSSDAHNLSAPYRVKASRNQTTVFSKLRQLKSLSDEVKVKTKTSMFTGFSVSRVVAHNKVSNIFTFKDSIKPLLPNAKKIIANKISNEAITYVTRFHIPIDKKIKIKDNQIVICGKKIALVIEIDYSDKYRVKRYSGNPLPHIIGWRSEKSGELKKSRVVELRYFEKKLDVSYTLKFKKLVGDIADSLELEEL